MAWSMAALVNEIETTASVSLVVSTSYAMRPLRSKESGHLTDAESSTWVTPGEEFGLVL